MRIIWAERSQVPISNEPTSWVLKSLRFPIYERVEPLSEQGLKHSLCTQQLLSSIPPSPLHASFLCDSHRVWSPGTHNPYAPVWRPHLGKKGLEGAAASQHLPY